MLRRLDDATAARRRDVLVRDTRDQVGALADALTVIEAKIPAVAAKLSELRTAQERTESAGAVRATAAAVFEECDQAAIHLHRTHAEYLSASGAPNSLSR